ncbi:MAG TPA: glycoside hydrolase family 3 N-terminal domain-containing protein [Chitinophagaceae bacterium]|nr:glycoside hydrolase family 3 N-terminal domain-containing protein [Chitinophagaceae bacterium]
MKKNLWITGILITVVCMGMTRQQRFKKANSKIKDTESFEAMNSTRSERHWVDSVFKTMTPEQRVAQLIFIRAFSNKDAAHINQVKQLITDKHVGGLVFFQGSPVRQAELTNEYQSISKVPLFISMDAEWGVGMRLDSVINFPRQLTMGAVMDSTLVYAVGKAIGDQCRRLGVQIDFAPVVDINNNPNNPVINDRSYGENKYRVARWGIQYMKGLQSTGVIACAKHFPGHGDTNVDSHKALPVVNKTMAQLKNLEMYPFQQMVDAGVASIMVAHLHVPAIDKRLHRPTSLSYHAITRILKHQMGFKGLVFTDALEMKGVSDYFSDGRAGVQALLAGNDILLLPENVDACITRVLKAIHDRVLSRATIDGRVKKVLAAKYRAGLAHFQPVNTAHLTADLNAQTLPLVREIYTEAITVLNNENYLLPLRKKDTARIAFLGVGGGDYDALLNSLRKYHPVDDYSFDPEESFDDASKLASKLQHQYDKLIIGVGNYNRYPANNFGISATEISIVQQMQQEMPSVTIAFGNPYAIKHFCHGPAIIAAYEDDSLMQHIAGDLIFEAFDPSGKLPVTICPEFTFNRGLTSFSYQHAYLPYLAEPKKVGADPSKLYKVDSIARDGIAKGAYPGCEVLAMKDGKIFYHKAFGTLSYAKKIPVDRNTIYDMASCTKICATTMACMKLYDEGKLKLDGTLGEYLPWLRGSDKASLKIKDVMMHEAGFIPDYPYLGLMLTDGTHPNPAIFHTVRDSAYSVRVAEDMYMRKDYQDTLHTEIRDSKLGRLHNYIYSDIDFQLMGLIVARLSGLPLNEYVKRTFYDKIGMNATGFRPRERYPLDRIAPTECEKIFRMQCLHGDVHDPRSALFGGVAGHAGLFSDAYDLAALMQMMLQGGTFDKIHYLKPATIKLFTSYQSRVSRRGIGFDKPAKDQSIYKRYPYPCKYASPETFGHTGYTGTCVWVDPKYDLVYVFLSNRVNPSGGSNLRLEHLEIRGKIQDAFYEALGVGGQP